MSDRPPSILWITLDSVRYDGTSMAGYERYTTPRMAELAAVPGGVSLANCFAHGNWTRWTYQRGSEGAELFELPDEGADVADPHPDVAAGLSTLLDGYLDGEGRPVREGEDARFTEAQREQRRDLGYVE